MLNLAQFNPYMIYIKAAGLVIAIATVAGFYVWFNHVLDERKEFEAKVELQREQLVTMNAEVKALRERSSRDAKLLKETEEAKLKIERDLSAAKRKLKEKESLLDEATKNCFNLPLPAGFLDELSGTTDSAGTSSGQLPGTDFIP